MHIAKRLFWIIGSLFALLLAGYLSFPWWAKLVIERGMPPGWHLRDVNLEYPRWQTISLNSLTIESTELSLTAETVTYDISERRLAITRLSGHSQNPTTEPPVSPVEVFPLLQLPDIKLNRILAALPFNQLTIEQLIWQITQNSDDNLNATQLKLTAYSTHASLQTQLLHNHWLTNPATLAIDLNYRRNEWLADIDLDEQQLLTASYRNAEGQQQLHIKAPLVAILPRLPKIAAIDGLDVKGQLELQTIQNLAVKEIQHKVSVSGDLLPPGLNESRLNFMVSAVGSFDRLPTNLPLHFILWSDKPLKFQEQLTLQRPSLDLTAELNLALEQPLISRIQGQLTDPNLQLRSGDKQLTFNAPMVNFKYPDFALNQFNAQQSSLQLTISPSQFEFSIPGDAVQLSGQLSGQLNAALNLSDLNDPHLSGKLMLSKPRIGKTYVAGGTPLVLELFELNRTLTNGSIKATFSDQQNQLAGINFTTLRADLSAGVNAAGITGKGKVWLNEQELTPLNWAWKRSTGNISLDLPEHLITNALANQTISSLLPPKSLKLTIDKGELRHQGGLTSFRPLSFLSKVNLSKAELSLGKTRLKQVEIAATIRIDQTFALHSQLSADEIEFDSGLTFDHLQANLNNQPDGSITVTNLSLNLLDGHAHSAAITLLDNEIVSAPFQIEHFSLTELSQLLDFEGLSFQGKVDVTGNIQTKDGGVLIHQFKFVSSVPGIISYAKGKSLGLDSISAKALSNFHYRELEGEIVGADEEHIPLRIRLLGSNPDLHLDREMQIELNLNNEVKAKELAHLLKNYIH